MPIDPSVLAAVSAAVTASAQATGTEDNSPVAQVRKDKSWEYGPFVNYGNGIGGDRSSYHFFSLGVEAGKVLTPPIHAGIFSGQFQYAANIMPLWQAYTPAPHIQTFVYQGVTYEEPVGGGTYTGVSLTPAIFRWNFLTHSKRWQPWFQAAGGLIYTTHKFPPDVLVPHGLPGGTSVWNFSPQGGIGEHPLCVGAERPVEQARGAVAADVVEAAHLAVVAAHRHQ